MVDKTKHSKKEDEIFLKAAQEIADKTISPQAQKDINVIIKDYADNLKKVGFINEQDITHHAAQIIDVLATDLDKADGNPDGLISKKILKEKAGQIQEILMATATYAFPKNPTFIKMAQDTIIKKQDFINKMIDSVPTINGSNDLINMDVLATLVKFQTNNSIHDTAAKALPLMDKNKDGKISLEEVMAFEKIFDSRVKSLAMDEGEPHHGIKQPKPQVTDKGPLTHK